MKIFVGYGYNSRDEWIKETVFPIIESFEGNVVTGEDMPGLVLSDGVKSRITDCDALLAFFTPRDEMLNGKFTTHSWVRDEFLFALTQNKEAVPFVELKVDWHDGMAGNRQRITFAEEAKDKVLVELAKILAKWKRSYANKRLRFLPPELNTEIRPLLSQGKIKCTYRYMIGSWESPEIEASLRKIGGSLCVDIVNLPSSNGMVQVKISSDESVWTSDYEPLDLLSINVLKE